MLTDLSALYTRSHLIGCFFKVKCVFARVHTWLIFGYHQTRTRVKMLATTVNQHDSVSNAAKMLAAWDEVDRASEPDDDSSSDVDLPAVRTQPAVLSQPRSPVPSPPQPSPIAAVAAPVSPFVLPPPVHPPAATLPATVPETADACVNVLTAQAAAPTAMGTMINPFQPGAPVPAPPVHDPTFFWMITGFQRTNMHLEQLHTSVKQAREEVQETRQEVKETRQEMEQRMEQFERNLQQIQHGQSEIKQKQNRVGCVADSRTLRALVEYIVDFGMDTTRGHVVAYPVFIDRSKKPYVAICTHLVFAGMTALFKAEYSSLNRSTVNTLLRKLDYVQMTKELGKQLTSLFAVRPLNNQSPDKMFVVVDVEHFWNAYQTCRESAPQLNKRLARDFRVMQATPRCVWVDDAAKWESDRSKNAVLDGKMAWNSQVQREVLENKAVRKFFKCILKLRGGDGKLELKSPFHFRGLVPVSTQECAVKTRQELVLGGRQHKKRKHRDSASDSDERDSGEGSTDEGSGSGEASSSDGECSHGDSGAAAPVVRRTGKQPPPFRAPMVRLEQLERSLSGSDSDSDSAQRESSDNDDDRLDKYCGKKHKGNE